MISRIEVKLLAVWTALAAAIWSLLSLASELREGELTAFDRWVLLALRQTGQPHKPIGPIWLTESMRDITALGGVTLLLLIVIASAAALFVHRKGRQAVVLAAVVALAYISNELFKAIYGRPRPVFAIYADPLVSQSFPSGHSTVATATYLLIAVIICNLEIQFTTKILAFGMAAFLAVAIGASRVYLGVHWPSDVLAGWILGACWAMLGSLALRALGRSGEIYP